MRHGYKQYCKDYENIENYEKAKAGNFVGWCCHHRLETHNSDGERRLVDISAEELIALDMYYNRPSSELIFLTITEHNSLHKKGKQLSEEHKKKIAEAHKGKQPMLGKTHSEKTRRKIGEANIGRHWYNNGKINVRVKECPPGFTPGVLKMNWHTLHL